MARTLLRYLPASARQSSPRSGALVGVRCPSDLDPLMLKGDGLWEPGIGRWLIEPRRIRPLVCNLRRDTDPLFRVGLDLD